MIYSTRRFVVCLSVCHFVLVFFSPFSIAITSLGEERANLSAFRTFFCLCLFRFVGFLFLLGSGKGCGLWHSLDFSLTFFVIVALPGLFSYVFFFFFFLARYGSTIGFHLLWHTVSHEYLSLFIIVINLIFLCFRFDALTEFGTFMRTEFLCISVLRVASGLRVKLANCKSALNPTGVYSTCRSKADVSVLVLFFCCFVVYSTR